MGGWVGGWMRAARPTLARPGPAWPAQFACEKVKGRGRWAGTCRCGALGARGSRGAGRRTGERGHCGKLSAMLCFGAGRAAESRCCCCLCCRRPPAPPSLTPASFPTLRHSTSAPSLNAEEGALRALHFSTVFTYLGHYIPCALLRPWAVNTSYCAAQGSVAAVRGGAAEVLSCMGLELVHGVNWAQSFIPSPHLQFWIHLHFHSAAGPLRSVETPRLHQCRPLAAAAAAGGA